MFSISDQELQDLIDKHNGKQKNKDQTPIYDLKSVVEYGLLFLYAKIHFKDGKVCHCGEQFNIYKKHKCSAINKSKDNFIVNTLDKSRDAFRSCWTGYNLAILTSDFILQGYFKKNLLFQKKFPEATTIVATTDKICVGLFTGEIIHFDPITQNEIIQQSHSKMVTALYYENGYTISSSMDGSIFYKKKIQIEECGILDVKYISEDKFVCSCENDNIILYNRGEKKEYSGHRDRIKTLSYMRYGISTSKDGWVGFLREEDDRLEMYDLGCSYHKRMGVSQFFGYGHSRIFQYDVNQMKEIWSINERSLCLDVKNNLMGYSCGKEVKIMDLRSMDVSSIPLNVNVIDLNFSETGEMLFVSTEQSPVIIEIKNAFNS